MLEAVVAHALSADCFLCVSLPVLSGRSRERFAMPKGWTRAPVLDGWVQIVRGPRPKAAQWLVQDPQLKTKRNLASATPKTDVEGVPPLLQACRPPDAVAAEDTVEVQR